MNDRRFFLLTAGAAAITLARFGGKSSALAAATPAFQTTSLLLPLSDVFFEPPSPCIAAGENVPLAGNVHVVTTYPPEPDLRTVNIYLNMAGVQGTGQTSGSLYIGTGSNKLIGAAYPPEPFFANFALEPTNGCASVTLPLSFNLVFASDGTLLPESSVSVFHPA